MIWNWYQFKATYNEVKLYIYIYQKLKGSNTDVNYFV